MAGVLTSAATVTPQGWWRYGENPDYYADSTANARRFGYGFSCVGSGNAGGVIQPFGCGGPLGDTGVTSTSCVLYTCGSGSMWGPGGDPGYNPPATNYVIECWCLPIAPGHNNSWLLMSGSGGGVALVLTNGPADTMVIRAMIVGNGNPTIGDPLVVDTTSWTHLAIVNNNGTNTFYVNGLPHGAPDVANNTVPAGVIHAAGDPGSYNEFHGYMDELRISTFEPGQFSTTNLLLRPPGPSILTQPQSATVWNGGAAPFTVVTVIDGSITYKWQRAGADLPGETAATLLVPQVSLADNGAEYRCILTASSISVTSAVATLTVMPNRTADVNYYRQAVNNEASLLAYFPVDGDTGTTLSNTKDPGHNGTLEGAVTYDGRTNRAFGQRALAFQGAGDVQIYNNPAFEFSGGNGTIEALVYLASGATAPGTIFGLAWDGGDIGYALQASADGSQLLYVNSAVVDTNNNKTSLSWSVPASLIGRQAHVALVIDHMTNVTAILDGQSLGTKVQVAGFGSAAGASAWIGALSSSDPRVKPFAGTLDEVAVYGSALSLNTIQVHYSRFVYGTNVSAPSIVSQPGARTVLAGTAPLFNVQVAGTMPISFQWTSNGVAIPGANASTFKVVSGPGSTAANYVLNATNDIGWAQSQPIAITFTAPPSPYSAAVSADHPLAYWRLDEASGPTTIDSAGYHDATYSGSPVYGAPSVITTETNKSVDFAAAGRATLSNYPELNPRGPFSVELWARPHGASSGVILGSQNRANSRGGYVFNTYFYGTYGIDVGAPNASVTRYYSNIVPQDGVAVHLVFAWDGVSPQGTLYVNGEKTTSPQGGYAGDMNNFVNNTVQPLTIGIRYDGSLPWNGAVDEVAFYDYALSAAQVTNHWSFSWLAATITQNPVGVTNTEWSTISMTVAADGYPNFYQWYKGSTALNAADVNPDGSLRYPAGVTGTTLQIAEVHPADSGQYHAMAINARGNATSTAATVVITPDTAAPVVTLVQALGTPNNYASAPTPFVVKVVFSNHIDPVSGSVAGNYTFTPSVGVDAVTVRGDAQAPTLGTDFKTAFVQTKGLTPGQQYTLTVTGLKSQAQTGVPIVPKAVSFVAPPLQHGALVWDYYYLITGGVAGLVGNTNYYPNYAPATNSYTTVFDSTQITGGDLNNNPAFGPLGDNYGCSLSGWITPTVSGDYTFFIASDDASQLHLNPTGPEPSGAFQIAEEVNCCNAFLEPGAAQTSVAFTLTAGTSYFIRALQTEGGGGDWVKVAWRMAGDSTPAANLTPIPGQYLSSYVLMAPTFNPAVYSNGQLTISWTGYQTTLLQSTNVALPASQWTVVPGSSPYVVTPATTGQAQMYYRLKQ